ncbi:hypothetical protein PDL68_27150 [Bacillus cereus]|uniref:hypothetical protein n=1 Tax=Bacillus cereus group TaxID=86661 RepID=UPI001FAFDB7B|nr:hypothetical protein [Bacillus cereus]MCJ0851291.1 hypothetical protein [Bacillus cereus]MDA1926089.1 hypothetical protein [Bacillus cereus]MDA2052109.1 hypothetical protein [Bacillus cereus]MDA2119197.1 hypothetical protein [Bacillus cereus]MDA2136339.1 hypothetical protein [Bacillus cereus]
MSFKESKEVIAFTPRIEHYYLKVKVDIPDLNGIVKPVVWNWEMKIAVDDNDQYSGMAIERKNNGMIHWIELENHDYVNEMKELCIEYSTHFNDK